jgi:hypothetical protein
MPLQEQLNYVQFTRAVSVDPSLVHVQFHVGW